MIKNILGAFGLFMIVSDFLYGHGDGFKRECVAHKVVDYDMGSIKNLICDLEFDIKGP